MRKRTTIDLDMALLNEAARLRLVDLDPDLTVERLQVDRAGHAPTT